MHRWFKRVGLVVVLLLALSAVAAASSGSRTIEVLYQDIKLVVKGKPVTSAEEPFILNGRTYVPLRLVAEALGEEVHWDEQTSTVLIGDADPSKVLTSPVFASKVDQVTQEPLIRLNRVPRTTGYIYACVLVDVKDGDVLSAKWFYQGRQQTHLDTLLPVNEEFQGWASFHIENGGKPWPAGTYRIEISLNGKPVQEKSISVN